MTTPSTKTADVRLAMREMLAAQRRLRGREAQRTGVTLSQLLLLRVLVDGGPHTSGDLARKADLTPASTTNMLHGLVAAGIVERVRDSQDRRRVVVDLTDQGREAYAAKETMTEAAYVKVLEPMAGDEVAAVAAALRRVAELLDAL